MGEMTMRERMLAIVRGHHADRVPFVQYDGIAAPSPEIWETIGRNNMGLLCWSRVHAAEATNCRIDTEEIERGGRRGVRQTMRTPAGELTAERFIEPTYGTSSAASFFVKEPGDYDILEAYLRDTVIRPDFEAYAADWRRLGDDGLPMASVGRTPYQALWIQYVGLENLVAHMMDCPGRVAEIVELLGAQLRQIFRVARQAVDEMPVAYVNIGDNITAPVIGERYFREYCLPLYNEMGELLDGTDVPLAVHMDGDLRALWKAIAESRVGGLDSFSPAPDNDVTVAEAMEFWPGMRLLLNFPSSVHLRDPHEIYTVAKEILDQGGDTGRLWIQISENVPPGVWRKSFPEIIRAIDEFGPPGK